MTSLFTFNGKRFFVLSVCATLAVVSLFFFDIYFVNDSDNHTYAAWESVTEGTMLISEWPVVIYALIIRGQDPPAVLWMLLWVLSGIFWGLIIEVCWRARERARPNI